MNVAALPRMAMPSMALREVADILVRASNRLDYTHGARQLNKLTLFKALNELEILPFERKAVIEYKRKMLDTQKWVLPWKRSRWYIENVRHYDAPIPVEVLEKVVALREKVSGYTYGVEYFARERRFYDGDPFLVVQNEFELYYIAVWDEPGFKI